METRYKTEQEAFWAGEFGDDYVDRNRDQQGIASRTAIFSKIFATTRGINSVLEIGANIGINLHAIRNLIPNSSLTAVEINDKAAEQLAKIERTTVKHGSILDFSPEDLLEHDLTFTTGVLIHLNPEMLPAVYERLYECSTKYILINEYYNPTPVEVSYRGHTERLFKRDFAGEIMDKYPDLELLSYGFQYHRDYNFPDDDSIWFLMAKKSA